MSSRRSADASKPDLCLPTGAKPGPGSKAPGRARLRPKGQHALAFLCNQCVMDESRLKTGETYEPFPIACSACDRRRAVFLYVSVCSEFIRCEHVATRRLPGPENISVGEQSP